MEVEEACHCLSWVILLCTHYIYYNVEVNQVRSVLLDYQHFLKLF